jgi:hypothetical protein
LQSGAARTPDLKNRIAGLRQMSSAHVRGQC